MAENSGLSKDEIKVLIESHLELLRSSLLSAANNYSSVPREVVRSLYYAFFHAANLVLGVKGITSTSHAGTQRMLALYFVRGRIFPANTSANFEQVEALRGAADYLGYVGISRLQIEEAWQKAGPFVEQALDYACHAFPTVNYEPAKNALAALKTRFAHPTGAGNEPV